MIVPWEVYATRRDALQSLGNPTNDADHRIATPSFLLAHNIWGVLCVHYDAGLWTSHVGELQALLRSLPAVAGLDRVVLDFGDRNQHVGSASIACIYSLYWPVNEIRGRFALCGLTKNLLDFFRWHDRERISFPSQNNRGPD